MGQYYKAVIIDTDNKPIAVANSWDCNMGAKLMEHSYFNRFVQGVVNYIKKNPKSRLVWAGDYANEEPDTKRNIYDMLYDKDGNIAEGITVIKPATKDYIGDMWIVNHDKKVVMPYKERACFGRYCINPLPLLTCEGNGRGGGDYEGVNMDIVGSWSRDRLSVVKNYKNVPKGYAPVEYIFSESFNESYHYGDE